MTNTDLVLSRRQITPSTYNMISQLAVTAKESKVLDIKRPQEAIMKMVVAYEMNLPIALSFSHIYIIDDKPILAPKLIWGMVMRHPDFHGYAEEILWDTTDHHAKFVGWRITLKREMPEGVIEVSRQFTMEDAKNAGLLKKNNWQNYPRNMCYWRAMSHVQDAIFPDAVLGYGHASFTDVPLSETGEIIDGDWSSVEMPFSPDTAMDNLIDHFGAEDVAAGITASGLTNITTADDAETVRQFCAGLHPLPSE